jgi:hypothetical protein
MRAHCTACEVPEGRRAICHALLGNLQAEHQILF